MLVLHYERLIRTLLEQLDKHDNDSDHRPAG